MGLARLGGGDGVRAVREILGGFTEGADTADVRAAQAIAGGAALPA